MFACYYDMKKIKKCEKESMNKGMRRFCPIEKATMRRISALAAILAWRLSTSLSGLSHKEQRNGSGAGMGSYRRTNVIDEEIPESEPLLNQIPDIFRILQGVPMTDKYIVIPVLLYPGSHFLTHVIHQGA